MTPIPPTDDLTPAFVDALCEFGFEHGVAMRIAEALEDSLDRLVDRRSAAVLVDILGRLGDCAAGEALKRVLIGSEETRLAAARRIGCSPQAIIKAEKVVDSRLQDRGLHPMPDSKENV